MLRPRRNLFYSGTDPVTLLDDLRGLGHAHVTAHTDEVPALFELEAESCYLWWEIRLVTGARRTRDPEPVRVRRDDVDLRVALIEDQETAVALLVGLPAETLDLFAAECREHLEEIERRALALDGGRAGREAVDAVFRAVHSIKGNAGLLLGQLTGAHWDAGHALPLLRRVAHAVESRLEPWREAGAAPVEAAAITLLLEACDVMRSLVEGIAGCQGSRAAVPAAFLAQLGLEEAAMPVAAAEAPREMAFANTAGQCLEIFENCLRELAAGPASRTTLTIYERGLRTLAVAAQRQGRVDLEEPLAAQLRILDAALRDGREVTGEDQERLSRHCREARNRLRPAPAASGQAGPEGPEGPAPNEARARTGAAGPSTTIRIDQEKLDRLMRVAGELLVAKNSFPTLAARAAAGEDPLVLARLIKEASAGISRIAEEMQDSVMAIRMLPVKTLFQRFPRLVRDLARSLGKEVQLVLDGETTALDKTILEQIGDPLVHLVRNAVDHGLETPEERQSAGKPAAGRLELRAGHEAGSVVIQVADDGRGLNTEALKRKAVERGLLGAEAAAAMPPGEACRLIFLPGLSTASQVTEISGRGVGMDVVWNNIQELHGTVEIASTPGAGTTFTIKLPTSLIVSRGILLEAGGQEYILPLGAIADMVKIPARQVHRYAGRRMAQIRGEVYSLFSLAEGFGLTPSVSDELPVALIESGKLRYGLMADRFVSEVEVVLKPLPGGLEQCREFHGAAILGDGRVVLVLDPAECCREQVG